MKTISAIVIVLILTLGCTGCADGITSAPIVTSPGQGSSVSGLVDPAGEVSLPPEQPSRPAVDDFLVNEQLD